MRATFLALASLVGLASAAPTAVAPPSGVSISGIKYGGTGCPQGSATVILGNDKTTFSVIFDAYTALVDSSTSALARQNCQLAFNLNVPNGYTYTLTTVNYRGQIYLEKGVTAQQTATYFFAGNSAQASKISTWKGPVDYNNWVATDSFGIETLVWASCKQQAPLNINSALFLQNTANRRATGFISTDNIDGGFEQKYSIQYRRC
ncbi:hypothetical protein HK097_000760 [Rhizophlyctis rosea]|uniref:DUF4360 domain-containing protein n=1 Tax=Rhizophlyctis rosea TaxID=64517 RepID=A0AAD5WYN6_9FUNG|nr:hypothetical protein HK097_000760 [Rhizophlyctis rosea]